MAIRTYTVTVSNPGSGNKYYIDGVLQDTLNLGEGYTYVFNYPSAHPLDFLQLATELMVEVLNTQQALPRVEHLEKPVLTLKLQLLLVHLNFIIIVLITQEWVEKQIQ